MPFDCRCCDDDLPFNAQMKRFDARYWHIDYALTAIATIVSTDDSNFKVYSRHRSNRDLIGVLWSSTDLFGHPSLSYETNWGYQNNVLCFQSDIPDPYMATVTVNAGAAYVCRLFPYIRRGSRLVPAVSDFQPIANRPPSYDYSYVTGIDDSGLPEFSDMTVLFAGQSQAAIHFLYGEYPDRGVDEFQRTLSQLFGVSTLGINCVNGATGSTAADRASAVNPNSTDFDPEQTSGAGGLWWWDLEADEPGPAMLHCLNQMGGRVPKAIIWSQGDQDAIAIEFPDVRDPKPTLARSKAATMRVFDHFRSVFGDDVQIFIQEQGWSWTEASPLSPPSTPMYVTMTSVPAAPLPPVVTPPGESPPDPVDPGVNTTFQWVSYQTNPAGLEFVLDILDVTGTGSIIRTIPASGIVGGLITAYYPGTDQRADFGFPPEFLAYRARCVSTGAASTMEAGFIRTGQPPHKYPFNPATLPVPGMTDQPQPVAFGRKIEIREMQAELVAERGYIHFGAATAQYGYQQYRLEPGLGYIHFSQDTAGLIGASLAQGVKNWYGTYPVDTEGAVNGMPYFVVDFNNLRTGFDRDGDVIAPFGITSLFFSLTTTKYGLGPSAKVKDVGLIKTTKFKPETIDHITVYCDPGVVISKGDLFLLNINVPTPYPYSGGAFGSVRYAYTWKVETLELEAAEFVMNGPDEPYGFKIRLAKPVQAAWRGNKATAQFLRNHTPIGDLPLDVQFRNINVTGGTTALNRRFYPDPAHDIGMTSGFDDTYNITPWRQIWQAYQLGYRGFWTSYMGMSHYFESYGTLVNGKFKVELKKDAALPLNHPTVKHLEDLFRQMSDMGYKFVWSTAYEILNSVIPVEWKQLDADQNPALTGWSPPSSFIIPAKDECLDYLARVIKHGMSLLQAAGVDKNFQIGEPWWWDGSYSNRMPCIYDPFSRELYKAETGQEVPTPWIRDFMEPVTENQRPYLLWLRQKLARSTRYIADSVQAAYPDARSTLLFFTPQIMNPAAEMLTIINFPKEDWVYPNYDFMQIEDYDWLINGQMRLNPLTFEAALDILGYPAELVHYFVGFVNTAREAWVWPNMNLAIWNAQDAGIGQISVWAYPQVIRDGMFYRDGERPVQVVYPDLPRIHDQQNVDAMVINPVLMVNINDEAFLWSGVGKRTYMNQEWDGVGYLGKISNTEETLQGSGSGWQMQLIGIPVETYQEMVKPRRGQTVTLYMAVNQSAIKMVVRGKIYEQSVDVQGGQLSVTYRIKGPLSLMRDSPGGTYTLNEQLIRHPGDMGLEFITAMKNFKIDWGK